VIIMQLPLKLIVVVVIVVLILLVVSSFLISQSSQQLTQAEANRIFNTQCQQYASSGCEWDVTRGADFPQYLNACETLYGQERDSFSCLYSLCQACKEIEINQVKCAGMCNICEASDGIGIDPETCCSEFTAQCNGVVECDTCSI
jgi:type II secretory pathway pseudopilin PulG